MILIKLEIPCSMVLASKQVTETFIESTQNNLERIIGVVWPLAVFYNCSWGGRWVQYKEVIFKLALILYFRCQRHMWKVLWQTAFNKLLIAYHRSQFTSQLPASFPRAVNCCFFHTLKGKKNRFILYKGKVNWQK